MCRFLVINVFQQEAFLCCTGQQRKSQCYQQSFVFHLCTQLHYKNIINSLYSLLHMHILHCLHSVKSPPMWRSPFGPDHRCTACPVCAVRRLILFYFFHKVVKLHRNYRSPSLDGSTCRYCPNLVDHQVLPSNEACDRKVLSPSEWLMTI